MISFSETDAIELQNTDNRPLLTLFLHPRVGSFAIARLTNAVQLADATGCSVHVKNVKLFCRPGKRTSEQFQYRRMRMSCALQVSGAKLLSVPTYLLCAVHRIENKQSVSHAKYFGDLDFREWTDG